MTGVAALTSPAEAMPSPPAPLRAGDRMLRCLTVFSPDIERSKAALQESAEALVANYRHAPFDPAHIVRALASS
jgi:hypothetical protein